ncbi:AAA family ATPase [Marinobacter halophilus]|uniref:Response regulator receiver-like protein n=1 Tax=Marinobacter halophilus TaxID=1323740 RepID=A0A2T1KCF6_9GAMM|nr:response regulator receiver-like protein [Marinobacter halophilus]PSF07785.1 response regulator receiver-like protein [Marinobacter halophilus]GGC57037.1 pilus assembly protein CpaE [Marinobacter halophilus]
MSETIICVADDVGARVWLERALGAEWHLECVSSTDLSRVSRLVQATGTPVVIVAIDDKDANRALKVFAAIQKACVGAQLVGVAHRLSQDLLLNIMRAGARDCLITGVDSDTALERVRRVADSAAVTVNSARVSRGMITLVTSASPVVDARFFSQNFVAELNEFHAGKTLLALDTSSEPNRTFYFDNLSRLTMDELITQGDSIDRSFIETALEEYQPGLRLLSGQVGADLLHGDSAADLYIAITQLAGLFDHLVIRVDSAHTQAWLKAIGASLSRVINVIHPAVDQVQATESLLKDMREWLADECPVLVVVDGYEKRASLSLADIEKTINQRCDLTLPLEWRYRLDAINAGVPISNLLHKSGYHRNLGGFVRKHYATGEEPRTFSLKRVAG